MARRTVIRAINSMEKKGLLTIEKTFGRTHHYQLHTGATVSPVTESHTCQKVTTPVTQSHNTCDTESHEPKRTRKNQKGQRKKFTDDHMAVAKEMADILQLRKAPNLDTWADTVRLMVERDGLACDEVISMFKAAQADAFWSSNILSPGKLREKWDRLERQLKPRQRINPDDKWRYI